MTTNQEIPKIIFQTGRKKIPKYVVNMIKNKCKGWDYKFFNDDDIVTYFKTNSMGEFPEIEAKFNRLNGAHKADLFRYYFLYINGGVFLDSDAVFEKDIELIIKDYEFVSLYCCEKYMMFNGFIATTPKNSIIYEALKDLYYINPIDLKNDYHLVCKNFYKIVEQENLKHNYNKKIFQEKKFDKYNGMTITCDDESEVILKHYYELKTVPYQTGLLALLIDIKIKFLLFKKRLKKIRKMLKR